MLLKKKVSVEPCPEGTIGCHGSAERPEKAGQKAENYKQVCLRWWPGGSQEEHTHAAEEGGKLERTWLGPYTITKLESKSADLRDDKGRQHPKINTDHLKPFTEPIPRIPHRVPATPPEKNSH